MRISSPPTKWPCYYGIDTPTRGELIASSHSVEEINQYITSDTLAYLPLDAMIESVVKAKTGAARQKRSRLPVLQSEKPLTKDGFCVACWTGEYPIEFTPHPRQRQMRLLDV
jgi:amidophosphoribosyltransferase